MKKGASIRFFGIKIRLQGLGLVAACLLSGWTVKGYDLPGMLSADTTDVASVGDTLRGHLSPMKDTVSPSFLECTCEGVLHVKGKSREEAAVQWMEEHFDSLQSACYAAGVLIEKAADILQLLPHMQEAEAGKEAAQHG